MSETFEKSAANLHESKATAGDSIIAAEKLIEPVMAHDRFSFEELQSHYNFRRTSDRRRVFVRLIREELGRRPRPIRVLDIGCGNGISEEPGAGAKFLRAIRNQTDELWGVEPDPEVEADHGMFDRFERGTLESAQLPDNYFDAAFSFLVMEHVDDPSGFMKRVFRCLKPGGVYFFLTPNARHYFTRIAKAMHALRIDEWVLRKVVGSQQVDECHYPVRYRFNSERQIRRGCAAAGLAEPEFCYLEDVGPEGYFPGRTAIIFRMLSFKRKLIHSRSALLDLVCRVRKPG